MFALNPVDPGTGGQWNSPDPSFLEAAAAKWRLGRSSDSVQGDWDTYLENKSYEPNNILSRVAGAPEEPVPPLVQPDELNKKFALPGLTFTQPEYEQVAAARSARHQQLMTDRAVAEAAPVFSSLIGAPSWAIGMLATLTRPLDAGLMLLPGVGIEASATRVGRGIAASQNSFIRGITRLAEGGIVPRAAVPYVAQFPKLAPSIANNAIQQAIMEVPAKMREIQETGSMDLAASAQNMIAGGLFAEGLRMTGSFLKKAGDRFYKAALDRAHSDMAAGRPVDVSQEVAVHSAPLEAVDRALKEERAHVESTIQQTVNVITGVTTLEEIQAGFQARAAQSSIRSFASLPEAPQKLRPQDKERIADIIDAMEAMAEKNGRITRRMIQERRVGYGRAELVLQDLKERGIIDSSGYLISKRPIPEAIKAAIEKEVQERVPEVARTEGVDLVTAERRARNKVSLEIGKMVSAVLRNFQAEGHLGHATADAAQAIAQALLNSESLPKEVAGQLQNHLHVISELKKGNLEYVGKGKTTEEALQARAKKMGSLIGVNVVKDTASLPTGSTLARIPEPIPEGLPGIADALIASQHEQLAKLGDAAIGRAERIKAHLEKVVQERVDFIKKQNMNARIEDGRVVTEADLKARREALAATQPDPELVAEAEASVKDSASIEAENSVLEKELGDLTPQEQAQMEALNRGLDELGDEKIASDAIDCIITNG